MEIRELSQSAKVKSSQELSLFGTYLHNFDAVKDFYRFNFRSQWNAAIRERGNQTFERRKLVDILTAQNKSWKAPAAVLDNISKLTSRDCFAVITGQQAGVFTGPLYTIYKIITTINLSEWLTKEHPNYVFVPCFWLEVDDHDFKEINHIRYFTKENELRRLELSETAGDDLKPVYKRQLNAEISGWKSIIKDEFYETEFMNRALEIFFEAYSSNRSYVDAFATLASRLFGEYGLAVLNPADPEVKRLGMPIYQKAIEAPQQIQKQLNERDSVLGRSGLPAQIQFQPQQTLLFYTDDEGQRVRIDFDENGDFLLKYADKYEKLEREKLAKIIAETPERISSNVALRPLIQDSVLPTIGYVAGPAEIAYFAQISTLYDYFGQTMPVIYPRHRMTIVESKIQKSIEKSELDLPDLFSNRNRYLDSFIRKVQGRDTFNKIDSIQSEIRGKLNELEKIVREIDPTLINAIRKTEQKMESGIGQIMDKITNAVKQKEAVEINQVKKALLYIFPDENYQERVINIIYFLIKYGPDFISALQQQLPVDTRPHYLIYL